MSLPTDRLLLRRWRDADREPFARMNADPAVMRYFPAPLSRAESDAMVDRVEAGFEVHGFGLWAVEVTATEEFIGFVGLAVPRFTADFTPCVEVGWRLTPTAWGHGYASEAARRSVEVGFADYGLPEIVSMTATANAPSLAVMQRLGMTHDPADDFDHPLIAAGHPLQRHVLYRTRPDPTR